MDDQWPQTLKDRVAIYTHHLRRTPYGWKIDHVKQTVVWNTGNPSLHGGVRKQPSVSE